MPRDRRGPFDNPRDTRPSSTDIEQLESDIVSTIKRTRTNVVVDQDRRDGEEPWVVEKIGDFVMLWGSLGRMNSGASKEVFLTENREPGGASLFRNEPMWTVTVDDVNDVGGVAVASGPDRPSGSFSTKVDPSLQFVAVMDWVPAQEVWSLTVTNSTGAASDFLLRAQGV